MFTIDKPAIVKQVLFSEYAPDSELENEKLAFQEYLTFMEDSETYRMLEHNFGCNPRSMKWKWDFVAKRDSFNVRQTIWKIKRLVIY